MPPVRLTDRSTNRRGATVAPKLKRLGETLRFQCPNTGREVDSGISTAQYSPDQHSGSMPNLQDLHDWQVATKSGTFRPTITQMALDLSARVRLRIFKARTPRLPNYANSCWMN